MELYIDDKFLMIIFVSILWLNLCFTKKKYKKYIRIITSAIVIIRVIDFEYIIECFFMILSQIVDLHDKISFITGTIFVQVMEVHDFILMNVKIVVKTAIFIDNVMNVISPKMLNILIMWKFYEIVIKKK